jgi:CheY-like chemotaxis protein
MRTILVVDGNPLYAKLFRKILEHHGYRVALAFDGNEALLAARRELPDLIIIDCLTPSKHALANVPIARADNALALTPIITTSAFATEIERPALDAVGCIAFVRKPLCVADLVATVESALGDNAKNGPTPRPWSSTVQSMA